MIPVLLVRAGLLVPAVSSGQATPAEPENGLSFFQPLSIVGTNPDRWGLDEDDWHKYQSLMQGEAGLYYAHLEPSWILAMYEPEAARREQYLALAVQRDRNRNRRLLDRIRRLVRPGKPVDIFFLDARSENEIQQWARRMALPVDQVNSGRITLNFDDGSYRHFNTRAVPWIVEAQ